MPLTSGPTETGSTRAVPTTTARCYSGFGLTIASELDIPGAAECREAAAPVDLTVRLQSVALPPDAALCPPYRQAGDMLELTVPGVGRYTLVGRSTLHVEPEPGVSPTDCSALLVASGLPMALWARGGLLLHASAAIWPGAAGCLAIAGPSKAGKSLLLEHLVKAGARCVADDSVWIREQDGGLIAAGLPGGTYSRSAPDRDRTFLPFAAAQSCGAAPLAGIVFLRPTAQPPGLVSLTGSNSVQTLLRHRHRPNVPHLLGTEAQAFVLCGLLCSQVPMYALNFDPRDLQPTLALLQAWNENLTIQGKG